MLNRSFELVRLSYSPFNPIIPSYRNMNDSTQNFIRKMQTQFGASELVGRGNILNFGGQVTFAIRYSSVYKPEKYWFAIQSDFLTPANLKANPSPLGLYAALICGDEKTVFVIPQALMAGWMEGVISDRIHIERKGKDFFLRLSGRPLINVNEFVNRIPGTTSPALLAEPRIEEVTPTELQKAEITEHTRTQWMLIQFGRAAGYSVWVPAGDKGKEFNSEKFSSLTINELPNFGFDANTNLIISNIDVLWFDGNVIHKAFEIESTTSVYSGLLRMSDLVLSQPNVTIDLHIVAPLKRRDLVRRNILRPTFARLRPKCSFISFEEVSSKYEIVKGILSKQKAKIRDLLESESF